MTAVCGPPPGAGRDPSLPRRNIQCRGGSSPDDLMPSDAAVVERAAIAREEIVDRGAIFQVAFAHLIPLAKLVRGQALGRVGCKSRVASGDVGVQSLRQTSVALVLCTMLNAATGRPASRQLHLMSPHRLRTASPIRVTISLSIAAGVAKFSRANPA